MKEELIKFDTAVLAKEKGFNEDCMYVYDTDKFNSQEAGLFDYDGGFVSNANLCLIYKSFITAPSQSLLQRWLREVHGIHISPVKYVAWYCDIERITPSLAETEYICMTPGCHPTYETALEAALQTALKLIV